MLSWVVGAVPSLTPSGQRGRRLAQACGRADLRCLSQACTRVVDCIAEWRCSGCVAPRVILVHVHMTVVLKEQVKNVWLHLAALRHLEDERQNRTRAAAVPAVLIMVHNNLFCRFLTSWWLAQRLTTWTYDRRMRRPGSQCLGGPKGVPPDGPVPPSAERPYLFNNFASPTTNIARPVVNQLVANWINRTALRSSPTVKSLSPFMLAVFAVSAAERERGRDGDNPSAPAALLIAPVRLPAGGRSCRRPAPTRASAGRSLWYPPPA